MTQQTRVIALQEAVKAASFSGGEADILSLAETFNTFLTSDDAPATAASAAPATPAPTPVKAKATKAKPAPKPEPTPEPEAEESEETEADEAEETEETGPTGDDVKAVISKLIADGNRDELVSLLKKFKATSFSGLKTNDYPKFIAEGKQISANTNLTK